MSDLTAQQIFDVVNALIGEVDAVGDSRIDSFHLVHLEKLLELADLILDRIAYASLASTRNEYSMQKIGKTALDWLADSADWFDSYKARRDNERGTSHE